MGCLTLLCQSLLWLLPNFPSNINKMLYTLPRNLPEPEHEHLWTPSKEWLSRTQAGGQKYLWLPYFSLCMWFFFFLWSLSVHFCVNKLHFIECLAGHITCLLQFCATWRKELFYMQQFKCSEGKGLLRNPSAQRLDLKEYRMVPLIGHHMTMSHDHKNPKVSSAEINFPIIMHCAGKTSSVF